MHDDHFYKKTDKAFASAKSLAESELPPDKFFFAVVFVIVDGIDAVAGAIWQRTTGEPYELKGQYNLGEIQLDRNGTSRREHNELLTCVLQSGRPWLIEPRGSGTGSDGTRFQNPSDLFCLVSPILTDRGLVGLLEIWTPADHDLTFHRTALNYCNQMTPHVADYIRNHTSGGSP